MSIVLQNNDDVEKDIIDDAYRTVRQFFLDNPELKFIDGRIDDELCEYHWTIKLTIRFYVHCEGDSGNSIVSAHWSESEWTSSVHTEIANDFCYFDSIPILEPTSIKQLGKWYILNNETPLDIAIRTNNGIEVKNLLEIKHNMLYNQYNNQIMSLNGEININKRKVLEVEKKYNDLMDVIGLSYIIGTISICANIYFIFKK